jgi:DNA-binding transcriptional MocR family regulator
MENGELQRRVYEELQPAYGRRYRSMIKAINDLLVPLGVRLPQTDREIVGGYFIWLTLPDGMEGGALVERAREDENVVVAQVRTDGAMVMGTADSNTHPGRAV